MSNLNFKRTKYACYFTTLSTSSVFSLQPLLFSTFRNLYDISYTLLGTLVAVNFCTQLAIDLIFSFLSKHFNIHKTIRLMPVVTAVGMCIYAIIPTIFPQYAYAGLLAGTFIFSVAAGLGEVLLSPTVAACPSDNPEKDMSTLHSLYGYGLVGVAVVSTVFLQFVGQDYWMYLTLMWAVLPFIAAIMLASVPLPQMNIGNDVKENVNSRHRTQSILLCMMCIFLGACAENTMTNWISVYTEKVLNLPKIWGDLFGMALFATVLALTRTLYARYGKNIYRTLVISMIATVVFYATAAVSPVASVSLVACVAVGISTSMLWPGTLILMEERIPSVGVATYALMAAGGDLGASFAPQALGVLVDKLSLTQWASDMANTLSITTEQLGFKVGMLSATIFPLLGLIVLLFIRKHFNKQKQNNSI